MTTTEAPSNIEELIAQIAHTWGWAAYQRLGGVPGVEYRVINPMDSNDRMRYLELNFDPYGSVIELATLDGDMPFLFID